jgi:YD repeat-containing protein
MRIGEDKKRVGINYPYTYDLDGNQVGKSYTSGGTTQTTTSTYNGDNELTSQTTGSTTTTFTYDANGSQLTSTTGSNVTTYTYDVRNRLSSVTTGGVTTTYGYDDAGDRVSETTSGTTTYYLIDPNNPTGYAKPIEVKVGSPTAAPSTTYILGLDVIGQANGSGAVSYLLIDGRDDTRALVNSSGAVTATFNYDAFGNPVGFTAATAPTAFLFQQTMFDAPSGLNFFDDGQREEKLGAPNFIERDPSTYGHNQNPITLNLTLLDGADPINMEDLNGHDFDLISLTIAAGIGGLIGGLSTVTANYALGRPLTTNLGAGIGFGLVAGPLSLLAPAAGVGLAGLGLIGSGIIVYNVNTNPNATGGQKVASYTLLAASALGGYFAAQNYNEVPTWINPRAFSTAPATSWAQATLANFNAKAAGITDGIVGGYVNADGTVDFVQFSANGFIGHTAAQAGGAIPQDAIGGFSVGVKNGQAVDFNFNSALNGDQTELSPQLQQQIIQAIPKTTDFDIETGSQ